MPGVGYLKWTSFGCKFTVMAFLVFLCFKPSISYCSNSVPVATIQKQLERTLIHVAGFQDAEDKFTFYAEIANRYAAIGDVYSALAIAGRMRSVVRFDDNLHSYVAHLGVDTVILNRLVPEPDILKQFIDLCYVNSYDTFARKLKINIIINVLKSLSSDKSSECYKLVSECLNYLIYLESRNYPVNFYAIVYEYTKVFKPDETMRWIFSYSFDGNYENSVVQNLLREGTPALIDCISDKQYKYDRKKLISLISKIQDGFSKEIRYKLLVRKLDGKVIYNTNYDHNIRVNNESNEITYYKKLIVSGQCNFGSCSELNAFKQSVCADVLSKMNRPKFPFQRSFICPKTLEAEIMLVILDSMLEKTCDSDFITAIGIK